MLADPEQSAGLIAAARQRAEFRAAQYKRLSKIAVQINHDLALRRNAVLSCGGAAYGAGLYTLQPPDLARRLLENKPPQGAGAPQGSYDLLAAAGGGNAAAGHMQVTAAVAARGARRR